MERDCHGALNMNNLATHFYVVAFRRLRAEVCADASINRDAAGRDQLIAFSPRTDTGGSEEAIEAHGEVERLSR